MTVNLQHNNNSTMKMAAKYWSLNRQELKTVSLPCAPEEVHTAATFAPYN